MRLNFRQIILLALLTTSTASARLMFYCERQSDPNGGLLWMPPGTYRGIIHSNAPFNIRYPMRVEGLLQSAADTIIFGEGFNPDDLILSHEPRLGSPEYDLELRSILTSVRSNARPFISSQNHQFRTWVKMRADQGIDIYQYREGTAPRDSLIAILNPPNWQPMFVDGNLDIEGTLSGNFTIGCSGDMYLVDNVKYTGSDARTGQFDERNMEHRLGLISAGDIVIKNNRFNGIGNGAERFPDDHTRHSIIINALMVTDGRLRFEGTNADWEAYQGPTPDRRGTVYLKGALWQQYGLELFNSNHEATGFNVQFDYDGRFDQALPPYIIVGPNSPLELRGWYSDRLQVLNSDTIRVMGDAYINRLDVFAPCTFDFQGPFTLDVNHLTIISNLRDSVRFVYETDGRGQNPLPLVKAGRRWRNWLAPACYLNQTQFSNVGFDAKVRSLVVEGCSFSKPVKLSGVDVTVRGSRFADSLRLERADWLRFERNVATAPVWVGELAGQVVMVNNTFLAPGRDAVVLDDYLRANLRNNIIAFSRRGVVNNHNRRPILEYNLVYGSEEGEYVDCEAGQGSLSADPRFVDLQGGDYHLRRESPCIDAGDPHMRNDPDGSRADIGAFAFDRWLKVDDESLPPGGFGLTISPNPFNGRTALTLTGARSARWRLTDITGRAVAHGEVNASGRANIDMPMGTPAGVYVLIVRSGGEYRTAKVVLLP